MALAFAVGNTRRGDVCGRVGGGSRSCWFGIGSTTSRLWVWRHLFLQREGGGVLEVGLPPGGIFALARDSIFNTELLMSLFLVWSSQKCKVYALSRVHFVSNGSDRYKDFFKLEMSQKSTELSRPKPSLVDKHFQLNKIEKDWPELVLVGCCLRQ